MNIYYVRERSDMSSSKRTRPDEMVTMSNEVIEAQGIKDMDRRKISWKVIIIYMSVSCTVQVEGNQVI